MHSLPSLRGVRYFPYTKLILEKISPEVFLIFRYHGVLAPNAADRANIVPGPQAKADEETCSGRHCGQGQTSIYRRSWATLLGRVFRIDVTRCPDCGGRMKIIAALTDPSSIRRCLRDGLAGAGTAEAGV